MLPKLSVNVPVRRTGERRLALSSVSASPRLSQHGLLSVTHTPQTPSAHPVLPLTTPSVTSHTSTPHTGGHSTPLDSVAACTSVEDVLRCFLASVAPSNAASASVNGGGAFVSDTTPTYARWREETAKKVRTALVAHLLDSTQSCAQRCGCEGGSGGGNSPVAALEHFLLFLTVAEPDILRAVRQRCGTMLDGDAQVASAASPAVMRAPRLSSIAPGDTTSALVRGAFVSLRSFAAAAVSHHRNLSSRSADGGPHMCTALARLHSSSGTSLCGSVDIPYWCGTGCEGLDRVLGGSGFRSGWVTEVYGEAGAGKTQLGLQLLLQQAATDLCHAAVAFSFTHSTQLSTLLQHDPSGASVAQTCRRVFDGVRAASVRCAVVYLVSEDVPTSRLGPLATAAARRALRTMDLHPLLSQLPTAVVEAVRRAVRLACTSAMVLARLQIRHIGSLMELLRLLSPNAPPPSSPGIPGSNRDSVANNRCSLQDAVRMLSGSAGRAVVVLDSIAAAVAAGRSDLHGAAHEDASVATAAVQLRRAAATHNWCVVVLNQVRAVPQSARSLVSQMGVGRAKRARSLPASESAPSTPHSSGRGQALVVPALGTAWAGAAQCRVQLRKSPSVGVRQMILRHSPCDPPSQASYVITANGIEDA